MKVIFRTNGNKKIGMGHIVRCLALADALRKNEPHSEISFLTSYSEGEKIVAEKNYKVIKVTDDEIKTLRALADEDMLLITDFLDTDNSYICKIRESKNIRLISIDSNTILKEIDANIVINANVFDEEEIKVIDSTKYYLGPNYVILRKEFEVAREWGKKIKDEVGTILLMSGGADFSGGQLILNSVKALEEIDEEVGIRLIIGPAFPYINELNELLSKTARHFDVLFNPPNLVEIMENADIAITAAGITLYELATLGVPSIVIPQVTPDTSHQEDIARFFEEHQACINLGKFPDNSLIYGTTAMLIGNKLLREQLSQNARVISDGKGLERALRLVFEICDPIERNLRGRK